MLYFTHSSLEPLQIRGQDRVVHARFLVEATHHFLLISHLPIKCSRSLIILSLYSVLFYVVRVCLWNVCRLWWHMLHLTWGTHLGETKLVASMTGSPASESISIRRIFTSVGTTVWWMQSVWLTEMIQLLYFTLHGFQNFSIIICDTFHYYFTDFHNFSRPGNHTFVQTFWTNYSLCLTVGKLKTEVFNHTTQSCHAGCWCRLIQNHRKLFTFSFWSPSRGPTSTILTLSGNETDCVADTLTCQITHTQRSRQIHTWRLCHS